MLTINYLRNDSLDATELQTAKDIAALCIYTYGAAVSNARALVSIVEDSTIIWNDNTTCSFNARNGNDNSEYLETIVNANIEKMDKKEKLILSNSQNVNLYPNPTDNEINVLYRNVEVGTKFCIYNYIGEEITTKLLFNPNGILKIETNLLNNGLYLYKLVTSNGQIVNEGKINIFHNE
jgi:hypothetical protein